MEQTLQEKLDQINKLQKEIAECDQVLNIFHHTPENDDLPAAIDLKPTLEIEHLDTDDYEVRVLTPVPGALSKELTTLIERHVNMIKNGNIELLSTLVK